MRCLGLVHPRHPRKPLDLVVFCVYLGTFFECFLRLGWSNPRASASTQPTLIARGPTDAQLTRLCSYFLVPASQVLDGLRAVHSTVHMSQPAHELATVHMSQPASSDSARWSAQQAAEGDYVPEGTPPDPIIQEAVGGVEVTHSVCENTIRL
jgi:hypothetical protein